MRGLTQNHVISILFLLSITIRLFALVSFPAPHLDESAQSYLRAADILLKGNGFTDASFPVYNPPMYTMFIAFCVSLFDAGQMSVKVAQVLLDSLTIVMIFFITRKVFGTETGLLTAATLSIYPFSIYLTISIASEPLFTFFLTAFLLSSLHAVNSDKASLCFASGVLLGLATLTRATTQFVPLLFPFLLLLMRKRTVSLLRYTVVFCLSFVLVVLPWTLRNYVVLNDFIPVATGGGIIVLMGSSEKFLTIDGKPEMFRIYSPPVGMKPSQNDKFLTRAGIDRYKMHLQSDPLGLVAFMARKFLRLWFATESGYNQDVVLLGQAPIYVFALTGLILAWRKGKPLTSIPICVLIYFAILHWFTVPLFRYMIPVMPYVIGLAAFGIVTLRNEWITNNRTGLA